MCPRCGKSMVHCKCEYPTGGIISNANYTLIGDKSIETVIPLSEVLRYDGNRMHMYNPKSVKGRIFEYFNKQTEKGLSKYGHTLDDCPDEKFDWRLMIIEELIDCIQYQQKEIIRLERLLNPDEC